MSIYEQPCLVARCRYKMTHHTDSHKCGKCQEFGHGQVECGYYKKIDQIIKSSVPKMYRMCGGGYEYENLKVYCTSKEECYCRNTHTIEAHQPEFEIHPDQYLACYLKNVGPRLAKRIENKPGYYADEYIGHGYVKIYRNNNKLIEYKSVDVGNSDEIK